jgi:predicted dehydrogenase
VASRSQDKADAFAGAHTIDRAYGRYQSLLEDENIDAVYVSLPNSMHHEWTIKALKAGKHVLCEKPLASNAKQAVEMFDTATSCDRLLVEAFMYRSHPQTHAIIQKIKQGAIGRVLLVRTSFCYCTQRIADNIRFDASLDGGALMDIGCYCIDFARLMIWLARRCNLNVEHWRV